MLANATELYQSPANENNKTVKVVGSGPAGLTAAYFLRRLGYNVTIWKVWKKQAECLCTAFRPIVFLKILSETG
jgi:pyruvate/2-oxoglutarate dehydrogenase complex dihydrolipoamide dehydrogenase (E3) component